MTASPDTPTHHGQASDAETGGDLLLPGAIALYRMENACRVSEFRKSPDAEAAIAADFAAYRPRYLRKFQDLAECLAEQGLVIVRAP